MPTVQLALYVVIGLACVISIVTDVKSRLIYDVVTYPSIVICLALRFALVGWRATPEMSQWSLLSGLIGFGIGFGLFFLMMIMGGMFGGDVKLMGAVGAALGFPYVLYALMFIALVGGLEAILVLLWDGSLLKTFGNMGKKVGHWLHIKRVEGEEPEKKYVPYGVAIGLGTLWAMVYVHFNPLIEPVSQ